MAVGKVGKIIPTWGNPLTHSEGKRSWECGQWQTPPFYWQVTQSICKIWLVLQHFCCAFIPRRQDWWNVLMEP